MTAQPDPHPDPAIKAFGIALEAFRVAANLSKKELADRLGCTPAYVGQIEAVKNTPSMAFAQDLNTAFNTEAFTELWKNIADAKNHAILPPGFRPLVEAEQDATQISIFAPLLVPGLLQNEDYARRVLSAARRPDKAEELLAVRMGRQAILTKAHPPWLFLLIRERVIREIWPEDRAGQCKRLLDAIADHNVSVQVLPTNAPVFDEGGFLLLGFDDAPDVAYVEGANGLGRVLTEAHDVRGLTVLFNLIRSFALSAEESENLIRTIMEDNT